MSNNCQSVLLCIKCVETRDVRQKIAVQIKKKKLFAPNRKKQRME